VHLLIFSHTHIEEIMDISGFLQTVAQVSVAIAGFAALISAFRGQDRQWDRREITGRNTILEMSLAAAFFALIPFPIESVLVELRLVGVWRICSAGLLIFLILWNIFSYRRIASTAGLQSYNSAINQVFAVILVVVNIFLALNIIFWGTASVYMFGLIWMLLVSGTQFMLFIYLYSRQNAG
jgi:hypothetical protein